MLFTWIAFIIQALFSNVFLQYLGMASFPILVVVITSFFVLMDLSKLDFPKEVFTLLFLAFLFRLCLMLFDIYGRDIFVLPNSGYDSEMFYESTLYGMTMGDYGNGHIYSYTISRLFLLFGTDRMIAQFFNVLLSMHAIVLTYKMLGLYNIQEKIKYIVVVVMAFLPNYAIMSSILLRESIIIYLYIVSFYCFSKWLMGSHVTLLLLAFGFGLLVAVYHSGSIFLVAAYSIILILYDKETKEFTLTLKSMVISLLFVFLFIFIYQNYFELFFSKFSNLEDLDDVTDIYVMGGSGYSTGFPIGNTVLNFIINTPIRIFYFVFSPLPWDWRGQTDIIAFVFSGAFYGGTLYLAIRQVLYEKSTYSNYILILLVIIVFGLLFFAWGVSNSGTALRHRDKFIGLFILLLSFVLYEKIFRGERL